MSNDPTPSADGADPVPDPNTIQPLPGEAGIPDVAAPKRLSVSKKGVLTVVLLVATLVTVAALSIQRFAGFGRRAETADAKRLGDRPASAMAEPKPLDLTPAPRADAASAPAAPRIPAIVRAPEDAEPIGVHRTGEPVLSPGGNKPMAPEDAPTVLVSSNPSGGTPSGQGVPAESTRSGDPLDATRRNLDGYQQQLQGLLDTLTRSTAVATGQSSSNPRSGAYPLWGGRRLSRHPLSAVVCSAANSKAPPPPRWRPTCWVTAA